MSVIKSSQCWIWYISVEILRNQASLRLNVMEEGVVESATTISLPSTRPRSARVSFKFFFVAASMLGTDCMYRVLFFPPIEVVRPGARIWNWAELTRWSTT